MAIVFAASAFAQSTSPPPPALTLSQAIERAQANEPAFAAAAAAQKTAAIDSYLAKTALLPSVTWHNQALYTQPNGQRNQGGQVGAQASPVFIANNAVHEYASQAVINETLGLRQFADAQLATANAARATAELEVARRGLVATVVNLYYNVAATQQKAALQAEALSEAQDFTTLTREREAGREVAHADVVKAQLQLQQKQRDLVEAKLAATKSSLELGALLFPDPRTIYSTASSEVPPQLLTRDQVQQLAASNNPEIRSALASLNAANAGVRSARAAYLPDLGVNFNYGIDAPQFAARGPDNVRNLGYSLSGTIDLPVWDWFSTQKKVRQGEIQRDAAKVALTATQRRIIAVLDETCDEAAAARQELDLLQESVGTARESLTLTRLRYTAGESTALEVVDAQNSFLAARTAQADGLVRLQVALAALQLLTGSL